MQKARQVARKWSLHLERAQPAREGDRRIARKCASLWWLQSRVEG